MSTRSRLLTIGACALTIGSARAEIFIWTGLVSADWSDPNNWNPDDQGYPGEESGDSAAIPDATTDPVLDITPDHPLVDLAIGSGGLLTMNGESLTVIGEASIGGDLGISTDSALTISPGAIMFITGATTVDGALLIASSGYSLTLDEEGEIEFNDGCTVYIDASATFLVLDATATYNGGTFKLDGVLALQSTLEVLADLEFSAGPSRMSPPRKLKLLNENAGIVILADKTFTNPSGFTIEGAGRITGDQVSSKFPMFANHGTVVANASGVLLFDDKVEISGSGGVFRVDDASAAMRFERGTDDIIGDFELLAGLLDIDVTTVKADNFRIDCGATIEASGGSFSYQSTTGSGACDPAIPASPIEEDFTCD